MSNQVYIYILGVLFLFISFSSCDEDFEIIKKTDLYYKIIGEDMTILPPSFSENILDQYDRLFPEGMIHPLKFLESNLMASEALVKRLKHISN